MVGLGGKTATCPRHDQRPHLPQHRGAGVTAGDEVDIEFDTGPPDFAEALEDDDDARRFFDGLSYSKKQRFVLPMEQTDESATHR